METKPTPECQCGNGLMLLRKAGDRSTRPGELYYICPASLNHRKKFMWYDEYQGNDVIHPNSMSMEYTSGSSSGTKPTCIKPKGPPTQDHSSTQDCYPRKKESIAPTKEFVPEAVDVKEATGDSDKMFPKPITISSDAICCLFGCTCCFVSVFLLFVLLCVILSK